MSWLLPSALGIAAAAALVVAVLHFIARSRPLAEPFPTARFVPVRPIQARTRSFALSDLLLLAMRTAALVAIGAAVAGPSLRGSGRVARVIVADRSRAVASVAELRDSVRGLASSGALVVPFDSAIGHAVSSVDSLQVSGARGSLSAALAAGIRAGVRLSNEVDSVEIVVVSPFATEEVDDATQHLRATWPGRIHVVPIAAARSSDDRPRVEVRGSPGDAIASAVALSALAGSDAGVRITRSVPTPADTGWAAQPGHVLVHWPARDEGVNWPRRKAIDAIGGVTAGGATVVARFPRPWALEGSAIARWSDGEAAAVERRVGSGCMRDVAVLIDEMSDLALRAPFRGFMRELSTPCGGASTLAPLDSTRRRAIAGAGALASSSALRDPATAASRWAPWLLALGALLLIVELAVRRPGRRLA